MTICSLCERPVFAKGWCSGHYKRWRKHGDPNAGRASRGSLLRFVDEIVLRHESTDCLTWPFPPTSAGYGQIKVNGRMMVASRYVCKMAHGLPPTPKHEAAHSCGNGGKGCVNKHHLSWKTTADNELDKLTHGTHNRGERQGAHKLTEADVHEIRSLRSIVSQGNLANWFGVSSSTIRDIHNRRIWSWLS